MIIFLDENDVEYGALATIKATNAVNGERSITGEIISGDVVLSRIERGWRLRFEDEYYVVTYAKPIDEGKNVQVSFDAVHQFFWDFGKSSVYDQLSDGSHTFRAYLDFIFNDSGYRYDIESSLTVKAFEKQSFGYKNRLSLFNDIITSSGVEFQVNGKVVRILAKVGTDLSTVVRKNFNLNELGIEKNIGNFVTYQKGFGAYFDEEDHSKGRLIAEYTSPLASVYGKLEADPLVDERYKQPESLLNALKETVDNSYTISVSLDMEDLTRAGYRYTQPVAGDYIMAINETLGFKEKIRIVSFTSEYDVTGQLIKHTVTCNDIGSVKKLSASYTQTQHQAANAEVNANTAYEFANKALVSANGKNTNYYGDTFPVDNPKGTLKKGDLLFLTVGDTVKQYYWNGAEWVTNPVVSDVEAFKEQIAEELKDVPNREEFENKISEEIANSKAEIGTQIETAKTQAESNAKEYADTINQETAKVAELAKTAADEIKADLVNVKSDLTSTSIIANNAQASVDEAKQDLAEVAGDLNTAKQDLMSHAQQLQTQANAQTELTKRVTIVETTANGTKTTVNELTKTVAQNGKDITSVTNRTKTVEDDLANTKTTLTQVQTTANSTSQKTATLETGLNGLNAKFDNLKIGGANLLLYSADPWQAPQTGYYQYVNAAKTGETYNGAVVYKTWGAWSRLGINLGAHLVERGLLKVGDVLTYSVLAKTDQETPIQSRLFVRYNNQSSTENITGKIETINLTTEWQKVSVTFTVTEKMLSENNRVNYLGWEQTTNSESGKFVYYTCNKIERGNIATDYSPSDADVEQKVAEYKQNADQNYASLSSTVQTLDGTVKQNKSEFDQTASQLKTTISAVEGKIPTNIGTVNLIKRSTAQKGVRLGTGAGTFPDSKHELTDWIKIEPSTVYTLTTYEDVPEESMWYSMAWYSTNSADYSGWIDRPTGAAVAADLKGGKQYKSPANAAYAKVSYPIKYSKVKLERGNIATDYNPNPEDYDAALTQAQSEFKQTTDAIKASVSSLDKSTVKSSSLTINTDGVVIKAGKSTSDFANAVGSYFSVNPNAINLFSDKINVKGSMIVSGAITSDKIASKQINTSHLNGKIITADVISSNAVTADAIRAGAVTTDKMSANSINGDRITAGTLDAAKIRAGSITASQIASGTITSAQIKTGTISAANIAAGAITSDKIAANSIDASKIAANAISANMINGGQLRSTNGATVFDLNAGTLTFNNDSGYIQRVVKDKIFEISTWLGADSDSRDWLASSFSIRKSDNSRRSGIQFQLYHDDWGNKPTAFANIWADTFHLGSSKGGFLLIVDSTNNAKPNWGDIPIAHINGGLIVKDIAIGGHSKSLLTVVEELCQKTGIFWV